MGCYQNHTWAHFPRSKWASWPNLTSMKPGSQWDPKTRAALWRIIIFSRLNWVNILILEPNTSKWVEIFLLPRHTPWAENQFLRSFAVTQLGKESWGFTITSNIFLAFKVFHTMSQPCGPVPYCSPAHQWPLSFVNRNPLVMLVFLPGIPFSGLPSWTHLPTF